MTTELFYLLLTAILTGVLWIPVVIGYAGHPGTDHDFPSSPLHDKVQPAGVSSSN